MSICFDSENVKHLIQCLWMFGYRYQIINRHCIRFYLQEDSVFIIEDDGDFAVSCDKKARVGIEIFFEAMKIKFRYIGDYEDSSFFEVS